MIDVLLGDWLRFVVQPDCCLVRYDMQALQPGCSLADGSMGSNVLEGSCSVVGGHNIVGKLDCLELG